MTNNSDRTYWLQTMMKIADPVLNNLAKAQLRQVMPVESTGTGRENYTHLEAFARLICGMAPWIEHGPSEGIEGELRKKYATLIRKGIENATDPDSPDYMNFSDGDQPIVDAAFLAHGIVRAPNEFYHKLPPNVQKNLLQALKQTRTRKPYFSNWLLFSAMIETALFLCGEDWDRMRVDFALKQHEQWYLGDGVYGDGPAYRADYYNSFVIHPMLVDVIKHVHDQEPDWQALKEKILSRAQRFATILERMISPEGAFPVIGRSIAYRFGAFQHLAQMALQHHLDPNIHPAQVRCALTAVMKRMMKAEAMFDANGWLTVGFYGHQPDIGEVYISTGSLYLCATVFLPLGLAENDPFWQGEKEWTAKKAWSGKKFVQDHATD